ncbi:MAG: radical SAM protein [Proteobacteria bacterium]|nr:radical SAM protein [Pseudomonadota bacterium]MBU1688346.1 radical SAM protein [Pseudomonadota bacterium]
MPATHPEVPPRLLYANEAGEICDFPELMAAGRSLHDFQLPEPHHFIPLPEGSELFVLPDRSPVGIDPTTGDAVHLAEDPARPGRPAHGVAAFMAPAHTTIYTAAFEKKEPGGIPLPLFAYTAVGWAEGRFWVCAFRSDPDLRQEPGRFKPSTIKKATTRRLKEFPENRLIQHLGTCSLTYGCPAAINFFMDRWEAPLPTSPTCNASCLGCISLQPSGCCPATQDRIRFIPTPEEIAEVAIPHLQRVKQGVVSFGQGCEGEPLLQSTTIEAAITLIRRNAPNRGTINLNSNSSLPDQVARLAKAGLDSLRVSLNSAQKLYHQRYYQPKGFCLNEVKESIRVMKEAGKFVSLNYFILPGVTDSPPEYQALCELIEDCHPDFIQLRNLNMDPDWYLEGINFNTLTKPMGILQWHADLAKRFPSLRFGYFNPSLRD